MWFGEVKSKIWITLSLIVAVFLLPSKSFALSEEELQLALLLKVSQFTIWENRQDQEFLFCLYRGKEYQPIVSSIKSMPTVGELPVKFVFLKQNSLVHSIQQCHILFVTELSAVETKQILRRSTFSSTLTVSILNGFADIGGMIELVKLDNRYTFRINLSPVKKSGISISSSLLEISTVIKGEK